MDVDDRDDRGCAGGGAAAAGGPGADVVEDQESQDGAGGGGTGTGSPSTAGAVDAEPAGGGGSAGDSDETDARPPLSPKKLFAAGFGVAAGAGGGGKVPDEGHVSVRARRDDDRYYMKHGRRGVAVVFNHETFESMRPRAGTGKDKKSLTRSLQGLGFDVRVYQDLKYDALREVLHKVAAEDHSDSDCLVVAVMSHGEQGGLIYARDHFYNTSQLWSGFAGHVCPSLLGKPKLFFIQACRGEGLDAGTRVVCDSVDSYSSGYSIPNEADVLVMYSTVEGYYSWRNPTDGSWFIQALCKELDEKAYGTDLLTMLTAVCRRVALHHKSCVPGDRVMDNKMQMPAIVSMLTRSLYFRHP